MTQIDIQIPEHWSQDKKVIHLLREILVNQHRMEERLEEIEEELIKMAQVQLSIGFTVAPGGTGAPLTVTPTSVNEDLTAGKAADGIVVATVTGGTPPYTIPLDSASGPLPDGISLAIDASGVITLVGTPTTASTTVEQVLVNVTDSAPPSGAQLRTAAATPTPAPTPTP